MKVLIEISAMVLGKHDQSVSNIIASLVNQGKAKTVGKTIVHMDRFIEYKKMTNSFFASFHKKNPLKIGMSKEELRTRLSKGRAIIGIPGSP